MTRASSEIFGKITASEPSDWMSEDEPRAGLRHVLALSCSKVSDGLVDPKLVLSWLMTALGAPAFLIGLIVPIREAGALLPQLWLAPVLERQRMRCWFWTVGAAGQGLAAFGIALSALTLEGAAAGWAIALLLAVLAVSRAVCSVSYKDILGKTIGQTRRGAITGLAGSAASAAVFLFALLMLLGVLKSEGALSAAIALAGALWLLASAVMAGMPEAASEPREALQGSVLSVLRGDKNLQRFVAVRGLLTVTALAPPYLVMLMDRSAQGLSQLGLLVLASAAASFVSSYVWGRLADASGRKALAVAGFAGASALAFAALAGALGFGATAYAIPVILFGLMLAYHGVRQSRSTYLVDISPEDQRASYAAAANSAIGLILLLTGALGGALTWVGPLATLVGFAVLAALGGALALTLKDA